MNYKELAQSVLKEEAEALTAASLKVTDESMNRLISIYESLKDFGGNLVFCGVGKSGVIAMKLASTFTSLGLSSYFLHPVEALHGDLGRVNKSDVIVLISKSGTTEEIIKLIPYLPMTSESMIGLVGEMNSPIAKACSINFDCSVKKEACLNNQAPTTSSTLAMAMGDAMAVVYEAFIGLSKENFAVNHPGGLLGKSMRLKVKDLMWKFNDCPTLSINTTLKDVVVAMTQKPVGGCAIVDGEKILGIIVEGDIRRTLTKEQAGLETKVELIMNKAPVQVRSDDLALHALKQMEKKDRQIHLLPVIDDGKFQGFIRLHDLLKEGLI